MQKTKYFCGVVLVGSALGLSLLGHAQQSPKASPQQAGNDSVHTIVLPQYAPEIPAGPHLDTYRKDCLLCHSARYVQMQPGFPQAVWEKEVKKMVDAYGAKIPDAEQKEIVEYLVAVRGLSVSK